MMTKKEEVENLISEIKNELNDIQNYRSNVKKILSEISSKKIESEKTLNSLDKINENFASSLKIFNAEKNKITSLFKQTSTYYENQFLPLRQKIDSPKDGLKQKLKESNSFSIKLKGIESDCDKKYSEIKLLATNFKKSISELKTIENSVRKLHSNISNNKELSDKNLNAIINIEKQSKSLNLSIINLEASSTTLFNSIKKLEKDANDKINTINYNLNISEEAKIKIQEIYSIAAETGRSGEFNNRSIQLKKEIGKWEFKILLFSIILAFLAVALFFFQLYLVEWKMEDYKLNFYLRFILLSPIVYYLIFSVNQHNKTQKLYDKYSFKTTLAMSIKHHIEILVKQDLFTQKGQIEKVLDFVLDAFSKIYNEPYSDEDYKMKVKLANMELEIEKKILEFLKSEK